MTEMLTIEGARRAEGRRFALVVSKYHDFVTERLCTGAIEALSAAGVVAEDICIVRVPGAFEIPLAAQLAAETARFHAIVCLGCLIKGETPHFDFIASAVSIGLTNAAAATGVPMAFGVLTTNSIEEALARAREGPDNKGHEAAVTAIAMASLTAELTDLAGDS
jgi:6,7-dimethyl-8-ribityllumazine synthase